MVIFFWSVYITFMKGGSKYVTVRGKNVQRPIGFLLHCIFIAFKGERKEGSLREYWFQQLKWTFSQTVSAV